MSPNQRPPAVDLPTLTEVIGFEQAAHAATEYESLPHGAPVPVQLAVPPAAATPIDFADEVDDWARQTWAAQAETELVQTVLTDVQRQIDHLFEYRVREALTPVLTRLTEALVRETREELGTIVRDVVRRAVAQELAKQRSR